GRCKELGVEAVLSEVWAKGGDGAIEMAEAVVDICENKESNFKPLYDVEDSIKEKIETIAKEMYGADGVDFSKKCEREIANLEKLGLDKMPICMSKTQYSFSDDPILLGRHECFRISLMEMRIAKGAGLLVAVTGDVMTMPGLPKKPAANNIDIMPNGEIVGLF